VERQSKRKKRFERGELRKRGKKVGLGGKKIYKTNGGGKRNLPPTTMLGVEGGFLSKGSKEANVSF